MGEGPERGRVKIGMFISLISPSVAFKLECSEGAVEPPKVVTVILVCPWAHCLDAVLSDWLLCISPTSSDCEML